MPDRPPAGELPLTRKTILITGGARGIGAETARRLSELGANVALVGLEPEKLEDLTEALGQDRVAWWVADVTDSSALEHAVAEAIVRFGAVDVAICNAGLHYVGALASAPIEQIERELEVNLYGVLRTSRAVLPALGRSHGYLLNVASLAAASHLPLMGAYAASKAGVEALSNCLRVELAGSGVAVGCVYLGFIDTDLVRRSFAHPSSRIIEHLMPRFVRQPAPINVAVDAIVDAVLHRKARAWAPRYIGGVLALRGVIQPLTEARAVRSNATAAAVRLADPSRGASADQHSQLGVALSNRASGDFS